MAWVFQVVAACRLFERRDFVTTATPAPRTVQASTTAKPIFARRFTGTGRVYHFAFGDGTQHLNWGLGRRRDRRGAESCGRRC